MDQQQTSYIPWRFYLMIAAITLVVSVLAWRAFDLAVLDQRFLRQQGNERILRLVSTPSLRGMLLDRNGFPLAVSTTVYSVWLDPQDFAPNHEKLASLANLIAMGPKNILAMARKGFKNNREFIYLKRALAPETAKQIKELDIKGLYLRQEFKRYYPEGEVTAQLLGFTNVDDQGQEGLELAYNQWLQGQPEKKWVIKDRIGRVISDVQTIQDQKPGKDLVLSIDRRIQYLAYRELLTGVVQNEAESGTAIVMDAKTGEILAMVNVPSFNPNHRQGVPPDYFRNRAVTDLFEPGSTIKAFTITSALESGRYKTDSVVDTSPGWMRVGHNIVKDHNNNGVLSLAQILQLSSNMGAAKIGLSLPPDELWSVLHRVGFGESVGAGFPGEQTGVLNQHAREFVLATLSFGYGMSTTALQLTHAYSVLADHGVKLPVSLLKLDKPSTGTQVLDPGIAKQMLLLLEAVFNKGGSAQNISIAGYRIAGKTGTSWNVGLHGYEKHNYTSSFVGIAPVADPRVIVTVVIHNPRGKYYYGGQVSGPIFQHIMEGTLRLFDVSPDES